MSYTEAQKEFTAGYARGLETAISILQGCDRKRVARKQLEELLESQRQTLEKIRRHGHEHGN